MSYASKWWSDLSFSHSNIKSLDYLVDRIYNPDAGDLRRHRAHYNVTVMFNHLLLQRTISISSTRNVFLRKVAHHLTFFRQKNTTPSSNFCTILLGVWSVCKWSLPMPNILTFCINPLCSTGGLNVMTLLFEVWIASLISFVKFNGFKWILSNLKTSNFTRFLNLTQVPWRLATVLQNYQQINVTDCLS